ncbi:DUF456 domain-containing protein [Georgenia subflava]|uniref:DUF456 family protein n=1 Tax=Georgenia subflava TaxID=1622177 RepID=A0A6N7ENF7_9MICO|nr:DUF456 domain-containing protein [Georgenia subflava]MPV38648.1 DUF456 family protein [Georgenia subflava]
MDPLAELLVGLVIVVGLVGAVVQVYPGSLIVLAAVAVWGVVTGGVVGWVVLVVAALAVLGAGIAKYFYAGRYLKGAGVPNRTLLVGAVLGVIGFFVVPVVGLPLGFVLGVYLSEMQRRRNQREAWRATISAMKATGLTILIELSGAMVATGAWVVGLLLT